MLVFTKQDWHGLLLLLETVLVIKSIWWICIIISRNRVALALEWSLVGGLSSAQSHFPLYACSTHCGLLNHRCLTEKNTPACFSTLFWRKSRLSEISSVRGQLWIFPHWLIAETSARPFYVQLTETVRWPRLGHRSFVCFIKGQNISADTCLMNISAYWATMSQIFTLISSNTNQNYNLIMRGMRGWWEVSENCA